jgi:hypothetical protein
VLCFSKWAQATSVREIQIGKANAALDKPIPRQSHHPMLGSGAAGHDCLCITATLPSKDLQALFFRCQALYFTDPGHDCKLQSHSFVA